MPNKDKKMEKILCVVCMEPIHAGAKKCIKCESFQNWRRYINFSSTVLSLLVALATSLSLLLTIYWDRLSSRNSKMKFKVVQLSRYEGLTYICDQNRADDGYMFEIEVGFLSRNLGNQAAYLSQYWGDYESIESNLAAPIKMQALTDVDVLIEEDSVEHTKKKVELWIQNPDFRTQLKNISAPLELQFSVTHNWTGTDFNLEDFFEKTPPINEVLVFPKMPDKCLN